VATIHSLQAWLALHLAPGMGPVTCCKLVDHFGSPEKVLAAPVAELAALCRLRRESRTALGEGNRDDLLEQAQKEIDRAAGKNVSLLALDDPRYPPLLKNIHDPPAVLYVLGDPKALQGKNIGMVGSRAASHYGKSIALQMAEGLANRDFTIVSGMALGIDTAAHTGALAAKGRTIAVLGCGLDVIYPPGNRKLYSEISASGAIVSEYPLGTLPESFRFPARNRIISGLSLGIVVVEAAKRSGALITAQNALEQGREVFAVPGRIDSAKSAGTHSLLQQGAKLVQGVSDIAEEFSHLRQPVKRDRPQPNGAEKAESAALSSEEAALFACLDVYPRTLDEITRESGFTPQKSCELLLLLELKGVAESLPGNAYRKTSALTQ
jgi:DNA processing protein